MVREINGNMGNTFFMRLQTVPAIAAYLHQLEELYEHQKQKSKLFKILLDVTELWLFLAKFAVLPLCTKFQEKIFNFDDFACKCLDHIQQSKLLFNHPCIQLPQVSPQILLSMTNTFQTITSPFSFTARIFPTPGDLVGRCLSGKQLLLDTLKRFGQLGDFVAATNQRNVDFVAAPKKLVSYVCSYVVQHLPSPECPWFASISEAFFFLPQTFNGPCKDLFKNFFWLHDHHPHSEVVIGYVPIHPDDLAKLWHRPTRLYWRRCYASR